MEIFSEKLLEDIDDMPIVIIFFRQDMIKFVYFGYYILAKVQDMTTTYEGRRTLTDVSKLHYDLVFQNQLFSFKEQIS